MTPFAPGRLSTITCLPSPAAIFGWMMRATRSVAPPGGKPTIIRTGLAGNSCAVAGSARSRAAPSAANPLFRLQLPSLIRDLPSHVRCLEPRRSDDLGPLDLLRLDVFGELLRRARRGLDALLEEEVLHVGGRE